MHPGIPVGVHVRMERAGRVLLMRRAGTGFFDGLWSIPGGHVEAGESLRAAAVREMAEETGLVVAPEALAVEAVVHRLSDTNRIDFFLHADRWDGEPRILEPHKCDGMAWFAPDALPADTVPYVRAMLGRPPGDWFLELGFPGL